MGGAERRQREREARKHDILEAAKEIFGREGYVDAAMEAIAERAGVNIATVYYYYASKEILYLAVLVAAMESVLPKLIRVGTNGASVREKLRGIAFAYAAFHQRYPDLMLVARYLGGNGHDEESAGHELAEQALRAARRALDVTAEALREGHRRSELRELDARRTSLLLGSALTGVLQASSFLRVEEKDQVIEQWLDLSVEGLAQH